MKSSKCNELYEADSRRTQLTPAEQYLKQIYQRYPNRLLSEPCTKESVEDILGKAFSFDRDPGSKNLKDMPLKLQLTVNESDFIRSDMDCGFVWHMRYTPAFWHRHDFFELLCVLHGSCRNIFHDREFQMTEGDICIHAPGTIHTVSAFTDDALLLNILVRRSTFEENFLGLMDDNSILLHFFQRAFYQTEEIPYLLFHTGGDQEICSCIKRAYQDSLSSRRYHRQMTNLYISQFFITLLRNHESDIEVPNSATTTIDNNLIFMLNYMQAHYQTITLHELATFFNYSDRQVQRILLMSTGETFTQNIQRQKMKHASDLLIHTDLPIQTIGEQVGYESQNNFRKIFRKTFGSTPTAYRTRMNLINHTDATRKRGERKC